MILQRTAEFFHAASALSCWSGLDNDMRLKCRDGAEGGRHHHRLTSYDQPVRLDIIGITCRACCIICCNCCISIIIDCIAIICCIGGLGARLAAMRPLEG